MLQHEYAMLCKVKEVGHKRPILYDSIYKMLRISQSYKTGGRLIFAISRVKEGIVGGIINEG